ncbi:cupin domain-containing protein [Vreelandella populi]|uniref:cupin domain-containing protein n=1 Tax=Vreelandella populi TaxID=2498858 RepID=UPI000F8E5D6A|nr:cupin domain-containing protein [Halomonas populi]RUR53054.1 cupin [Halomonas populi]
MSIPQPELLHLGSDETSGYPNSPLPVLIYRKVLDLSSAEERADAFESMFKQHGWPPAWRYYLYDFDHFHSTAHEALGIFQGQARARLGGPNGREVMLYTGDVLVLPAGVGHASLEADDDFCMVGAYPPGQDPEIERGDPAAFAKAQARVASVNVPDTAPVGGPLKPLWEPSA